LVKRRVGRRKRQQVASYQKHQRQQEPAENGPPDRTLDSPASDTETDNPTHKRTEPEEARDYLAAIRMWWEPVVLTLTLAVLSIYTFEVHKQTSILQSSALLDQRAWVGIEGVQSSKPEIGKSVDIVVSFRNSGKSPATRIEQYYNWRILPVGDEQIIIKSGPKYSGDIPIISHSTLFPNISTPIEIKTTAATDEWIKLMSTRKFALHLYGKISYLDTFKRPHWTTYCVFSFGDSPYWKVCQTGNATDDDGDSK